MQDRAIAAIGEWQLETKKDLEPVDLYIENMFQGKDYQMELRKQRFASDMSSKNIN